MAAAGVNAVELPGHGIQESKLKTCIPVQAPPGKWGADYHNIMLSREPKNMQIMFLGDSITMYWQNLPGVENGSKIWDKYYKPVPVGNYGISGDKTEHVLWRLTKGGDLRDVTPRVIVLLIGINNLYQGDSPEDTAEGIKTIVYLLRNQLPQSKILLLGIFPCNQSPADPIRGKIKTVNSAIQKLADGGNIYFLDIGHVFLEKDGSISKAVLRDYIHLAEKGYARWAEAMNPCLFDLLKKEGKSDV
jgi:lysophospholipase L1-like esterase